MKHTHEEILDALHVIKEECEEHVGCENCPFGTRENDCLIGSDCPTEWRINDDAVDKWKGLL